MEQLEEQRIQTWRDVLTYRDNFIHISPDASIYDAVKVLIDQRIHRLPMVTSQVLLSLGAELNKYTISWYIKSRVI